MRCYANSRGTDIREREHLKGKKQVSLDGAVDQREKTKKKRGGSSQTQSPFFKLVRSYIEKKRGKL